MSLEQWLDEHRTLADPDTLVVSDAHVHVSLVDGCRLARSGGVDEAHAIGVCGPGGSGLVRAAGPAGHAEVVSTMTLSKTLGRQPRRERHRCHGGSWCWPSGWARHSESTHLPDRCCRHR